jgi:surface protein
MGRKTRGAVTDMSRIFANQHDFNDDLSSWDTSQVTTMSGMFYSAFHSNQPSSTWEVNHVIDIEEMLE